MLFHFVHVDHSNCTGGLLAKENAALLSWCYTAGLRSPRIRLKLAAAYDGLVTGSFHEFAFSSYYLIYNFLNFWVRDFGFTLRTSEKRAAIKTFAQTDAPAIPESKDSSNGDIEYSKKIGALFITAAVK